MTEHRESLRRFVDRHLPQDRCRRWAWKSYPSTILELAAFGGAESLLEIGGGRTPLLSRDTTEKLRLSYGVNDISEDELRRAPGWVEKICFDIAGGSVPPAHRGKYDLVFSKMVMEHVRSAKNAYQNIFELLKPGGIVLNFHPVLYAPPFLLNRLLPEALTYRLLTWMQPHRNQDQVPKFPARYSHCVVSPRTERMILDRGFGECVIAPFFGHGYFENIPLVRSADNRLSELAKRRMWTRLATYAYTFARRS